MPPATITPVLLYSFPLSETHLAYTGLNRIRLTFFSQHNITRKKNKKTEKSINSVTRGKEM